MLVKDLECLNFQDQTAGIEGCCFRLRFDCGSNAVAGICVRLRAAVSDLCDPRRTEAEIEAPVGFAEKCSVAGLMLGPKRCLEVIRRGRIGASIGHGRQQDRHTFHAS